MTVSEGYVSGSTQVKDSNEQQFSPITHVVIPVAVILMILIIIVVAVVIRRRKRYLE